MITFHEVVQRRIVELLLEVPGNRAKLKSAGIKYHIPVDVVSALSFNSKSYYIILNFKSKYIALQIYKDLFEYVDYLFGEEDNREYVLFEDAQKSKLIINKLYINYFYITSNDSTLVFKNPVTSNKIGLFECSADMKRKFTKIKSGKTDNSDLTKNLSKQDVIKDNFKQTDANVNNDKILVDRETVWRNKKDDTHDEFGFEIRENFGFRE